MKRLLVVSMCVGLVAACRSSPASDPPAWSAWIDNAAIARGVVKPGDIAQFGCPPGWRGVEDTTAALGERRPSATWRGSEPPPREGTVTCVAQRELALPPEYDAADDREALERPLSPVWVALDADRTTIGFREQLPSSAAIYIGQDTPCGPRLIGVRLGDLLKWLEDPGAGEQRDFLGMVSSGCPS